MEGLPPNSASKNGQSLKYRAFKTLTIRPSGCRNIRHPCLAIIAILPVLVSKLLGVDPRISHFFGGTSLLILVGVILDTSKQIESHLIMKRYDGFMKRGRLSGR